MTCCVTETRTLRWTFQRDREAIVCELGLNTDDSAYQLRLGQRRNARPATTETFDAAMEAFQRQAAIERELIEEGWTLENFESVIGATVAKASLGG